MVILGHSSIPTHSSGFSFRRGLRRWERVISYSDVYLLTTYVRSIHYFSSHTVLQSKEYDRGSNYGVYRRKEVGVSLYAVVFSCSYSQYTYLAFRFAATLLEGLLIIGLVFTISNPVGAAMWADGKLLHKKRDDLKIPFCRS